MNVINIGINYEDPPKQRQPRCPYCQRFLPFVHNLELNKTVPNGHWDYDKEEWVSDGPDIALPTEIYWECKCGGRWEWRDIFKHFAC